MVFGKHLICQKVIVPYMTYADNGIVFTMKAIGMKLCRQSRVRSETASFDKI